MEKVVFLKGSYLRTTLAAAMTFATVVSLCAHTHAKNKENINSKKEIVAIMKRVWMPNIRSHSIHEVTRNLRKLLLGWSYQILFPLSADDCAEMQTGPGILTVLA